MSGRTFDPNESVDFIVVGSGAAGGIMARELSQAGFTVLVFEQGPRMDSADFEHDELKYQFLHGITNSPETSPQTFRTDPNKTAIRPEHANSLVYARIVGGSSNHFTANFWRFHDVDFHEHSLLGDIPGRRSRIDRSATRSSNRTTPKSSGRSASPDLRARVRSIPRGRSLTRCRRYR